MDKNPYFIKVLKEKAPILSDYVLKYMWPLTQFLHVLIEVFTFVQFIFFSFPAGHFSDFFFYEAFNTSTWQKVWEMEQTTRYLYQSKLYTLSLFLSPADYCIFAGSKWVSWGDCAYDKDTEPWYNSTAKTKTTTRRFALTRTRNSPMEREKQII